jgi:DNA polymerase III delta subunit
MGQVVLAMGSKENFLADISLLGRRWSENPRVVAVTGAAIKETVAQKASALFAEEDLVLALLDPAREVIDQIETSLNVLKEKVGVIIYSTSADLDVPSSLGAVRVSLDQEREKRIRERVLSMVRAEGKKMTDKAFTLLKERVRDEACLEEELAKLISYVGEKQLVEVRDVAAIVTEVHEEDFIALSEAIARRNKKEIIAILETLLSQGMNILAIHSFLTRHLGLLLQAKDGEGFFRGVSDFRLFSKAFGKLKEDLDPRPLDKRHYVAFQKPFYAYNLHKTSQKMSREGLLAFFDMLARFDGKVKKGTRHDRTTFEAGLLGV